MWTTSSSTETVVIFGILLILKSITWFFMKCCYAETAAKQTKVCLWTWYDVHWTNDNSHISFDVDRSRKRPTAKENVFLFESNWSTSRMETVIHFVISWNEPESLIEIFLKYKKFLNVWFFFQLQKPSNTSARIWLKSWTERMAPTRRIWFSSKDCWIVRLSLSWLRYRLNFPNPLKFIVPLWRAALALSKRLCLQNMLSTLRNCISSIINTPLVYVMLDAALPLVQLDNEQTKSIAKCLLKCSWMVGRPFDLSVEQTLHWCDAIRRFCDNDSCGLWIFSQDISRIMDRLAEVMMKFKRISLKISTFSQNHSDGIYLKENTRNCSRKVINQTVFKE